MSSNVYVVSDLHGNYEIFMQLLKEINFSEQDKLYIIGDIVDRGPDSYKIFLYIFNHSNVFLLKGNHELMMTMALKEAINNEYSMDYLLWLDNGGHNTIDSIEEYLHKDELDNITFLTLKYLIYVRLYHYLSNLPSYLELVIDDYHYVLVHAGIKPGIELAKQSEDDMLWIREEFYNDECDLNKVYVFGHTPAFMIHGSHDVWVDPVFNNKINIDGGLAGPGQLNCLSLKDQRVIIIERKID